MMQAARERVREWLRANWFYVLVVVIVSLAEIAARLGWLPPERLVLWFVRSWNW